MSNKSCVLFKQKPHLNFLFYLAHNNNNHRDVKDEPSFRVFLCVYLYSAHNMNQNEIKK